MKAASLLDNQALRQVLDLLNDDGEEARIVGGAVRNALLGRPVADHDIATTAPPAEVIARAKAARLRSIPTGLDHGTVTLVVRGRPFEVTTLREDIETDGRHAKIRFGRDFARDALRRDFTINALSMGLDGVVHDYAGGLADIAARRVRFIGDPATRIREDFLRILRFFRFSAHYAEGDLDAAGLAASIRERAGLACLSRERIRQEVLKLLCAPRAIPVVATMAATGLLGFLIGGVPQPSRLAALLACDPGADSILRLAAVGAAVAEDAERLRDRLRLSNAETLRLTRMTKGLARLHTIGVPPPRLSRELLFDLERQGALDALHLAWAESRADADDKDWRAARCFMQDTPEPRLPFSGVDLLSHGVAPGRPLGEALRRLQANWIKAGFPDDPRTLSALMVEAASG